MGNSLSSHKHGAEWDEHVTPPPPYEAASDEKANEAAIKSAPTSTPPIRTTAPRVANTPIKADTPQWRWNISQCQQWLTEALVEYCCKDRKTAQKLAREFEGFGPILYMKSYQGWADYLGVDG